MTKTLNKSQLDIVVLKGDGIGPEIIQEALKVMLVIEEKRNVQFNLKEELIGGAAIDATGNPFPEKTLEACKASHAVLLGAVGGPKWNDPNVRPEQGLLALRKNLDLYANLRPVSFPSVSLIEQSPLKKEIVEKCEFMMIRELVGGIYFGERKEAGQDGKAYDTLPYSVEEIQRVARLAGKLSMMAATTSFSAKPLPVHSIDKANVLATSRLWRKVVTETLEKEFPQVPFDHILVDTAAMLLVKNPSRLNGIVLTENMFGDILSDEASGIPGSLGVLPSASLCGFPVKGQGCCGVYEPIHGSAPDIAGQGIANPLGTILSVAMMCRYSLAMEDEAFAIEQAVRKVLDDSSRGGYEMRTADLGGSAKTSEVGDSVVKALRHIFDNMALSKRPARDLLMQRPDNRRPMTLCEKILCHNALNLTQAEVSPGDMICVSVDWTLASELTWKGMEKTYNAMGRPGVYRNDRFWLAIDHTVDPSINNEPKPKGLIHASESFAKEAGIVDFHGPNQTILHTEFYRQRAQPGMVVIGADSHSCSAGAVGAFAVGLGAADVVMPLVTGETWMKVPDTVEIRFVGKPKFGIAGKDTILYVLGELKRNTVAFERAVEYTGPGIKYLSCDARFAISNMTTEFGGIAGVFEADELTADFINKRKNKEDQESSIYFRADAGAKYVETHIIDLSKVDSMVALYPSPDNVVHVSEFDGTKLHGVFIGACTTAEEDLILAALVLEAGMKKGYRPCVGGKRKVTPGSVPIVARLRKLGLLKVYEEAGFEIGAPGCSYCLGIAADKAGEGEVWLSSQNRNFKNRMGKGSIGNIASAATVAASSFDMKVKNPQEFLDVIDQNRYKELLEHYLNFDLMDKQHIPTFKISEPNPVLLDAGASDDKSLSPPSGFSTSISGKVQRFDDHIDTDAIIPAEFMPGTSDEDLGSHAFQYVRPEFREKVTEGFTIVVAGVGFGSGSSREEAPRALRGCGVKCVIAKSFAFIYARNQPNMSLLGLSVPEDRFYELAQEGAEIEVKVKEREVVVGGQVFKFGLSVMEERLMAGGGVTEMYKQYGKGLFRVAMMPEENSKKRTAGCSDGETKKVKECTTTGDQMSW